jgi:hypothetical protein
MANRSERMSQPCDDIREVGNLSHSMGVSLDSRQRRHIVDPLIVTTDDDQRPTTHRSDAKQHMRLQPLPAEEALVMHGANGVRDQNTPESLAFNHATPSHDPLSWSPSMHRDH